MVRRSDLAPEELTLLEARLGRRRKSPLTLWLLWFFLGPMGAHRFYLGESVGVAYVFLWCFLITGLSLAALPLCVLLVHDALSNRARLDEANQRIEQVVIEEIWSIRCSRVGGGDSVAASPE